ncbi:hypothetical protein ACFQY9_00610 [Microvirga aerilata]|uniref:hypothetical protein n=1 Tax=Microvirga aerilata TaxID=670292 RepID=UPI003642AE63
MAKLHFIYSVMNAGKTTHLLQVRYNYIENGGNVLLFTSLIDDRFGVGKVKSRIGLEADAIPCGRSTTSAPSWRPSMRRSRSRWCWSMKSSS